MPAGRPSGFNELDLGKVKKLAKKGWTDEEMSSFFEVHRATWYRWKNTYPEFCDALKEWKQGADEVVERSLYERAIGYSHPEDKIFNQNGEPLVVQTVKSYPPDTTAGIFWLKNRKSQEWRDRQDINVTRSYEDMDDEELALAIRRLEQQREQSAAD